MLESVTNAATWAAHTVAAAATPFVFALPAAALSPVVVATTVVLTAAHAASHATRHPGHKLLVQAAVKDKDGKVVKAEESYIFNTEAEAEAKREVLIAEVDKKIKAMATTTVAEETKEAAEPAPEAPELAEAKARKVLLEAATIEACTQRGWDYKGSFRTFASTGLLATAAAASFAVMAPSAVFFFGFLAAASVAQFSGMVLDELGYKKAASVAYAVGTTAFATALFGLPGAAVVAALELVAGLANQFGITSVGNAAHATNKAFTAPVRSFIESVSAAYAQDYFPAR